MQFDKKALESLLTQSDQSLWNSIRAIAAASKINLPKEPPPSAEMQKLRDILSVKNGADISAAIRTVDEYRRKHGV